MEKFGIQAQVDDKDLKRLIETLKSLRGEAEKMGDFFKGTAQKMSKSFVDADGKLRESTKKVFSEQVQQATGAAEHIKAATERRVKAEETAEKLKFEELKEEYRKQGKEIDDLTAAKKTAATKEAKDEIQIELDKAKELRKVYSKELDERKETKQGKASDVGKLGTGRETTGFSMKGAVEIAGIGAAVEGLGTLVDKSKEVTDAEHRMRIAFGSGKEFEQAKKDAEELGEQFGQTGEEAGKSLSLIKSVTASANVTDAERIQLTKAYIAAQEAGLPVATKSLQTEEGRQKLLAMGGPLIKKAMADAQDPAKQAQVAMAEVEETGGELASTLLTAVAPAVKLLTEGLRIIKPILPEIAAGMALLTVAMNAGTIAAKAQEVQEIVLKGVKIAGTVATNAAAAAQWAMNVAMNANPIGLIIAGIVALVAVVVLLVKHWKDVVHWLEKAWETIKNAGGALLSFLGITKDASAATKEHTETIQEHKQSVEEVTQAYDDYTDALVKNADEQKKSSDEETKRAEAAIVDIQKQLRYATGAQKAALEERLQQYIAYGKAVVANAKINAANEAQAADEIGAGKKKEKKAKKAKPDKSAIQAALDTENEIFENRKLAIAAEQKTEAQKKVEERKAEADHARALLAIDQKFYGEKSKQAQSAKLKLTALLIAQQKDERAETLSEMQNAENAELSELEINGEKQNLTQKQIDEKKFQSSQAALKKEIALRASWGEDVSKLQLQLDAAQTKHDTDQKKNRQKLQEELNADSLSQQKEAIQRQIELRKSQGKRTFDLEQQLNALAEKEEDARYQKELEDRKDDLADAVKGKALRESLEANHEGKLTAIAQKGSIARMQFAKEEAMEFAGPVMSAYREAYGKMQGMMQNSITHAIGQKSAFQQLSSQIVSGYANMAVAAITSGHIQELADNAAAAAKFVVAGANAVAGAFAVPFPADLLAIGASLAAVTAAVIGVKKLAHFASGTDYAPGGPALIGERGPEIMEVPRGARIIPNHQIGSFAGGSVEPLVHALNTTNALMASNNATLNSIHANSGYSSGPTQGFNNLIRGQNMAFVQINSRKLR